MTGCIVCGGEYAAAKIPGLVKCVSCGFVSANLSLPVSQLKQMYGQQYFQGEEYRDYVADRAVIEKHFRIRLKTLLALLPDRRSRHLLEIGSAYGFFLSLASGVFATAEGVDISAEATRYASEELGQHATEIDFLDYTPRQQIDVVCMWDTIEHLDKPAAYIDKVAKLLPPGGLLAITTGDIESSVARVRGARWRQIHPPTHLHYFSKRTLTRLLESKGFRIRYVGSDGQYRSLDTMLYVILMVKHRYGSLYRALKRTGLLNFSVYLNLYDIVYIIAEKTA